MIFSEVTQLASGADVVGSLSPDFPFSALPAAVLVSDTVFACRQAASEMLLMLHKLSEIN